MNASRHRAAAPALHVRVRRLALPAALASCVTGIVVAVGVTAATGSNSPLDLTRPEPQAAQLNIADLGDRVRSVSRTARRVELEPQAVAKKYATADLNIWSKASDKSKLLGEVEAGDTVAVTGQVIDGWAEVLLKGEVRYVNADYLSADKPDTLAATAGISGAPCPDGSSTEGGLTANAVTMFRAICNAFPALSVYGGYDNHGEHADGRAVDFMTYENQALGWAVASWARAHAAELKIRGIIFAQRIWTLERAGEGWRPMSDRGSATANHYDHPHIAVL